jgi:hypothetical protein
MTRSTLTRLLAVLTMLTYTACGPLGSTPCQGNEPARCDADDLVVFCGMDDFSGGMILFEGDCPMCTARNGGGFSCEGGDFDSDGTLVRGDAILDTRPR